MLSAPSQQWAAAIRATADRHSHGRLDRLVLRTRCSGTSAIGSRAVPLSGRAERGMVLLG